jgi:hypothetical protein
MAVLHHHRPTIRLARFAAPFWTATLLVYGVLKQLANLAQSAVVRSGQEGDDRAELGRTTCRGAVISLPAVGNAAARTRQFYDETARKETDSTEVRVAREVFRWSSFAAGAAAVAMIVL